MARAGDQLEIIHEAPLAGQTEAESLSGGIAILHGAVGVTNARAGIGPDDDQPAPAGLVDHTLDQLAGARMDQNVLSNLGDGRRQRMGRAVRQASLRRQLPDRLSGHRDVHLLANRQADTTLRVREDPGLRLESGIACSIDGHGVLPTYRTTRTRASSDPLQCWAIIESASCWGVGAGDKPDVNAARMPSV